MTILLTATVSRSRGMPRPGRGCCSSLLLSSIPNGFHLVLSAFLMARNRLSALVNTVNPLVNL